MTSTSLTAAPKPRVREWAKQVALWLAIATLLPTTTWYATAAFYPPPDDAEYQRKMAQYADARQPNDPAESKKFYAEKDRLQKEHDDAQSQFYRRMFWVTYPVGLLVIVVGLIVPVQCIGAGFMFGGIIALAAGCYSGWDLIGRWAHFWSLIVALAVVVIAGFWRFRRLAHEGGAQPDARNVSM